MEFKQKYDEIKELQKKGKLEEALDVVESIPWRKVQNVNALVLASEILEEAGQLEEAKDLLYLAHERSPIGRMIIYHLAMLCIKMNELEEAQEYYDEFVEIAPHDTLKYIMKYTIGKAKGADNMTLIAILEELKSHEFLEEWSYELAYLYHKTMQIDKCIDLCDEIILWFGDGPFVERALEMKMIYQPLDKLQEEKYRNFQQKRDGITEIRANELLYSGEIVPQTIAIPSVKLSPDGFNTINLQAEIKKNIDEIMKATEEEAISENIENIKTLVEEIPYLQVNGQEEEIALEQQQAKEELDATIRDKFQDYLAEEYDGQISLLVPEPKEIEEQIDGQLTIEDVMLEWEKTRRAAEATLQEAQQQKLESAKNIALKEATQIMDRLEEAMPRLDAGMAPADLLKEEYMTKQPEEDGNEALPTTEHKFTIPKVAAAGEIAGIGLEIPVVDAIDAHAVKGGKGADLPPIAKSGEKTETKEWQPPVLEGEENASGDEMDEKPLSESNKEDVTDVDIKEATKIVADVNAMLQQEIDRILLDEKAEEVALPTSHVELSEEMDAFADGEAADESGAQTEESAQPTETEEDTADGEISDAEEDNATDVEISDAEEDNAADEEISDAEEDNVADEEISDAEEDNVADREASREETILPEIEEVVLAPEELAELVDENVLENAIKDEIPIKQLSEEEKKIFSYFMPISGMESTICQALTGAKHRILNKKDSSTGNIIIQGGEGSGKTMLASNLIKVLQNETGRLMGNVGKIDAPQLNQKDVATVFSKVTDGCLIIEKAGMLDNETMQAMCELMARKDTQVFVLLEDKKPAIEAILSKNAVFAAMFTEKITIPVFTIDELVNFGKVYALEDGYTVDEMGILAMYNRINLIQRLDHPTSLTEVVDIMEEAIEKAEKNGIKAVFSRIGTKRYDEEGNLILREKDFEI